MYSEGVQMRRPQMCIRDSPLLVSYGGAGQLAHTTEFDVQPYLACRARGRKPLPAIAVSYTHLDVYKRQD